MSKKVLMIVGSQREKSFNLQVAKEAAVFLEGKAEVSFLQYADLPNMNQDIEFPAPSEVERVRTKVKEADGIWIITPEYNGSYPGTLKNLLDWLSRPLYADQPMGETAVLGKKFTISGAGGRAATAGARGKLTELLKFIRTDVMETPSTGIALERESFMTNQLELSEDKKAELKDQAEAFIEFIVS